MATITSTQTGDWDATATWVGGSVPSADDLVVIAHGHRVTLDTDITGTRTGDVRIDGNLHFASGGKMHLHGRMTVKNTSHSSNNTGEFVEGTAASGSLLSMVGNTLIKISGDNSAQHGIQVDARKWCGVQIDGSEPTLKTELNGNHDVRAPYLTVDNSANFTAGDLISIYKREEDYRLANDECFWVHDVDTDNHRIYYRQFISPKVKYDMPRIRSVSGATMIVDDASVFRVGYMVIFGTGNNRNVLTITAINTTRDIITFGSSIDNDPSLIGEYVYQTGSEKYHLNDSHVRRTSSAATNIIGAIDDIPIFSTQAEAEAWGATNSISGYHTHTYNGVTTYMAGTSHAEIQASSYSGGRGVRNIKVNNAADFSVGDKIYIEACGDSSYTYASGSETNVWRHNLVYTISAINSLTLTVDRDIMYDMKPGGLITKMSRDVVIKACASNGDDVAYADQDTARVFFNVKYWTTNTWHSAPTRRVKIKYVEFHGLGYNTGDTTNFRAGVTIAGYNGYYDTKVTGSAANNSTVHTTSGVSQTGENYIDGCSYTSYNLCSNSTRDGDSYPSILIRHPYGMVARNLIAIGAGRGVWHWSSQYYIKSHGHISAANNYSSVQVDAAYGSVNEVSYCYVRMAEDYNFMTYNIGRQTDNTIIQHIDNQYAHGYVYYAGYNCTITFRRFYCDKYKYTYMGDGFHSNNLFLDSRFMPNYWDASANLYGCDHTPYYDPDNVRHYGSSLNSPRQNSGTNTGRQFWIEHGFRQDETVERGHMLTRLIRPKQGQLADYLVSPSDTPSLMNKLIVPANTVVKIRSVLKINDKRYDGGSNTVNDNSMPILMARSRVNCGLAGRHGQGVVTDTTSRTINDQWDFIADSNDRAGFKNSTEARGKIYQSSFIEYVAHTSSAQGAFETKELTVAAQYNSYELTYGYYVDDTDLSQNGFRAMPIDVLFSKPNSTGADAVVATGTIGRKSVRTAFNANKKRISGRI